MLTQKELMKNYEQYLIDTGLTEGSAKSYVSYVSNAIRHLSAGGLWTSLCTCDSVSDALALVELLGAKITAEIESGGVNVTVKPKTLRNYKSGVALLIPFFESLLDDGGELVIPSEVLGSATVSYSQADLKRIFRARLSTQDRLYATMSYPARLITKINNRKYKLYDRLIGGIKFLCTGDGKRSVTLKEIIRVVISGGYAYAETKEGFRPIYTETYRGGTAHGYRKADVNSIALLSLDHDSPMKIELASALKTRGELKRLSEDYRSFCNRHSSTVASNLASDFFSHEYVGGGYDRDRLLDEVRSFIDSLSLTVMHRSDNSSKNSTV